MPKRYSSLNDLLQQDSEAVDYFSALPEYVKEQVNQRAHSVNSLASLQDYAENLLRGDD